MNTFPIETAHPDTILPSLKNFISETIESAAAQEKPYFIHMLGVPGSGKSTVAKEIYQMLEWRKPTLVGFDRIMESIPEYHQEPDRVRAFSSFELSARAGGYILIKELLGKRSDIFLDHGGPLASHVELLRFARANGYATAVVKVSVSNETAKKRIQARQLVEGRHTPLSYVDERCQIIEELTEGYRSATDHYFEIMNEDERQHSGISDSRVTETAAGIAREIRKNLEKPPRV